MENTVIELNGIDYLASVEVTRLAVKDLPVLLAAFEGRAFVERVDDKVFIRVLPIEVKEVKKTLD